MNMKIDKSKQSIFLAGPTPRRNDIISWRKEALLILSELQYDGIVYIPENENFEALYNYYSQVDWEYAGLNNAQKIVFWIPREISNMPGFTTNVEFGYYLSKYPNKIYYGHPPSAEKVKYLDWLYSKETNNEIFTNLYELLKSAISKE